MDRVEFGPEAELSKLNRVELGLEVGADLKGCQRGEVLKEDMIVLGLSRIALGAEVVLWMKGRAGFALGATLKGQLVPLTEMIIVVVFGCMEVSGRVVRKVVDLRCFGNSVRTIGELLFEVVWETVVQAPS